MEKKDVQLFPAAKELACMLKEDNPHILEVMESNRRYAIYALLFAACLLMQMPFAWYPEVFCDETDNYYGGVMLSDGQHLYTDFKTHHMPLLYLLYAVVYPFIPHTVVAFRIAGYFMVSLLCVFISARYWKNIGMAASFAYPIIYSAMFAGLIYIDFHVATVCSELIQAQGTALLFLEFLVYFQNGRLKQSSYIVISIAIILIVGSVFTGVLFVLVVGIGFALCELQRMWRARRKNESIFNLIRGEILLLATILLPWAAAALYLFCVERLDEAVFSSYFFNQQIYALYQDTGGSPLHIMANGFLALFLPPFSSMASSRWYLSCIVFLYIPIIWVTALCLRKRSFILPFLIIACSAALLVRGWSQPFHLLPAWTFSTVLASLLVGYFARCGWRLLKTSLLFVLAGVLVIWYVGSCRSFSPATGDIVGDYSQNSREEIVRAWLGEEKMVANCILGYDRYLLRDGIVSINGCYLPWFADAYQEESLEKIKDQQPKVAFYNENAEVWGYHYSDYSSKIASYIEKNYICLNPHDNHIWVRADLVQAVSYE